MSLCNWISEVVMASGRLCESMRVGQVKDLFIIGGHDEWQRCVYFVVVGIFR